MDDILEALRKIHHFTNGLTFEQFSTDEKTVDAVARNLEVIGEAVKNVPDELHRKQPGIPWRKIADFGNVLRHAYFAVDPDIVWRIARDDLIPLRQALLSLRQSLD